MSHDHERPGVGERAARWLERARLDYAGLERLMTPLSDPALAVYLLQQCIEKAVKALLVAQGEDETNFESEFGHRSLRAYLIHFRKSVNRLERVLNAVQRHGGVDFRKPMRELRALKATGYRSEWASASSNRVSSVCDFLVEFRKLIKEGADCNLERILVDKRLGPALCLGLSQVFGEEEASEARRALRTNSGRAEIKKEVTRAFDSVWAGIALGYLAALTQPHYNAPRYPAPPCGEKDPIEAAKKNELGFELYRPLGHC